MGTVQLHICSCKIGGIIRRKLNCRVYTYYLTLNNLVDTEEELENFLMIIKQINKSITKTDIEYIKNNYNKILKVYNKIEKKKYTIQTKKRMRVYLKIDFDKDINIMFIYFIKKLYYYNKKNQEINKDKDYVLGSLLTYSYKELIINQLTIIELLKEQFEISNEDILNIRLGIDLKQIKMKNKENEILKNENIILELLKMYNKKTEDDIFYIKTIIEN